MSEDSNVIELSERDKADLDALGTYSEDGEMPSFHTVLEVWREVLKPAAEEGAKKPTPQWCNRMVSTYTGLRFADMYELRDRYFGKIDELLEILKFEISTDPDCLSYATPEEDATENSAHYKNLLLSWQQAVLQWELDWDCTDEGAEVELAAVSEVHKMFFGQTGLTAFLDNIKFEYTEADQQQLAEALQEQQRGEG